ncbi:MAG: chorismate pyruvate-lyase family protein [Methylococcaceae bacterium]|nr:chorismate pyruvate-lyase family protein [Methylococcaceae bacterium]
MDTLTGLESTVGWQISFSDENRCFDPVSDLLALPEHRPPDLEPVDLHSLSPLQRALLVTDGTVTRLLEAYTLEPIEVLRLQEETQTLAVRHPLLGLPEGDTVRTRQVLLQGRHSATVYAYAASVLALKHLPADLLQNLETEPGGLGRALLNCQIENRRELLWNGLERLNALPKPIARLMGDECISRTYRIIVAGKPVILINEKFPLQMPAID